MSNYRLALSSIPFAGILFFLCCTPIVYSPHAQNEMLSPHNPQGQTHEIGAAFALNKWVINRSEDTSYVKTYPTLSVSLFHNAYAPFGKFEGIGGIELICLPTQWEEPGVSGFFIWLKPFVGCQYATSHFTGRLNLSPLSFIAGYGIGELGIAAYQTRYTLYQISLLIHSYPLSNPTWWGGSRMGSGAAGFVVGGEYSFTTNMFLRTEYSYLKKPPISPFITQDELESIVGSVHYLTFGFFKRLK
jgi:hypothetical protein